MPKQIYSFAEAVDSDNRAIRIKDKPLNWGGAVQLCHPRKQFEITSRATAPPRFRRALASPPSTRPAAQDAALCDAVIVFFRRPCESRDP